MLFLLAPGIYSNRGWVKVRPNSKTQWLGPSGMMFSICMQILATKLFFGRLQFHKHWMEHIRLRQQHTQNQAAVVRVLFVNDQQQPTATMTNKMRARITRTPRLLRNPMNQVNQNLACPYIFGRLPPGWYVYHLLWLSKRCKPSTTLWQHW